MAKMRWVGDDRWNLLNCHLEDLVKIYPDIDKNNLRTIKKYYENKLKPGELDMSERSEPYEGTEREASRAAERRTRQRQNAKPIGRAAASQMVTIRVPNDHLIHHQKLEEALANGPISSANFTEHDGSHVGYIKNAAGEIEYTNPMPSKRRRVSYRVEFNSAQAELISALRALKPVDVRVRRNSPERKRRSDEFRHDILGGDFHFGYLRMTDGELIPTHDERAIELFHRSVAATKPDRIILGGDVVDFPMFSRWPQFSHYIDTLNPTVGRVAQFLKQLQVDSPTSKIVWVEGNHETRAQRKLSQEMEELLKFTKPGEDHPVLSIPGMFDLRRAGIEYVRGDKHGRYPVNDRLKVKHGMDSKAKVGREMYSTIEFNGHRYNVAVPEVYQTQYGVRTVIKYMMPMMGRVDGVLPSYMSTNDHYGRPDLSAMNWTQGFASVEYLPGDTMDPIVNVIPTNPHDGYFVRIDRRTIR